MTDPVPDLNAIPDAPPPQAPPPLPSDTVNLTKDEYATLLAEHALMKQQLQQPPPAPEPPKPTGPNKPLDQMNGQELANYLEANSLQPLVNTVMQIAVQQELQSVQQRYGEDFVKGKDSIYNICKENPHLSLEQGYLLWKGTEATKAPAAPKPGTPPPLPPPAHKPGISPASTEGSKIMSAKEAATAALKELNITFD